MFPFLSRPRRLAAVFLAVSSSLFAACEEFEDHGDVSDDELNGRVTVDPHATTASPVSEASSSSAASSSSEAAEHSKSSDSAEASGERTAESATDTTPSGPVNTSTEIGGIVWKGKDVSSWPVTTTLHASVGSSSVKLNYDKARVWPVVDDVCANAWAIVNINGTWYAGTFEYLRHGQISKDRAALDGSQGDHFKTDPLSSWRPQSGEVFGLMVSGLCRGGLSNVKERSNIAIVRWP